MQNNANVESKSVENLRFCAILKKVKGFYGKIKLKNKKSRNRDFFYGEHLQKNTLLNAII